MNTLSKARTLAVAAALILTPFGASYAATNTATENNARSAQIPFVNHGGIYNWQADGDKGLWVQDSHRNWYYASTLGSCFGLGFANSIGFDTHPLDTFDKFSAIVVPGQGRCMVQNLTTSDGPPVTRKAPAPTAAPAASAATAASEASEATEATSTTATTSTTTTTTTPAS